jgi:tetratricopeptide (TPR) repeat protein
MRLRVPILAIALAMASTLPTLVHAAEATPEAKELARKRYQQGAQAFSAGHFKDAIDLFLDADTLAPNPAFSYNIGLAYEELGDAPSALRWYRDYLRALPEAPDRADIEPRIAAAEQRLRERGVQQVTVLSTPDGATVVVDGRRVGISPWTGELPPGRHQVALELRGFADVAQAFELPEDHAVDVTMTMHADATGGAPTAPVAPAPPPSSQGAAPGPRVSPLTWTALGVGAAGLGTALGFELARSASVAAASEGTQLEGKAHLDQASTYQTVARVSLGIGAAFAAAGGVLLYMDLSSPSATEQRTRGAIGCSGPLCGVVLDGAF